MAGAVSATDDSSSGDELVALQSDDASLESSHTITGNSFEDIQNYLNSGNVKAGDTVYLSNSTYSPTSNVTTVYVNIEGITITGSSVSDTNARSTIVGEKSMFNLNAKGITLSNIDFKYGAAPHPVIGSMGVVQVVNDDCSILACNFENFETAWGGVISTGSEVKNCLISGCNFTKNSDITAATLFLFGSYHTVENCNFIQNSNNDGTIYVDGNNFRCINCNFTDNIVKGFGEGGAFCMYSVEYSLIQNCNFINNYAERRGGAILIGGKYNNISSCYFEGNSAENGGAIFTYSDNLQVYDSTFYHNSAKKGSAIFVGDSKLSVQKSNFFNNQAESSSLVTPDVINTYLWNPSTVSAYLKGGDNIANAIFNDGDVSSITLNEITYPFYANGKEIIKVTPNSDLHPTLVPSEDDSSVYQSDLENNQILVFEVWGGDVLVKNESLKTDIYGCANFVVSNYRTTPYVVKVYHPNDDYYTYIGSSTKINIFVDGTSDLTIFKSVSKDNAFVGDIVEWKIVIMNVKGVQAHGVMVTDIIPEGFEILSVEGLGEFYSLKGNALQWHVGALDPLKYRTLIIQTKALAPGNFSNVATISGSTTEWDYDNNEAVCTIFVAPSLNLNNTNSTSDLSENSTSDNVSQQNDTLTKEQVTKSIGSQTGNPLAFLLVAICVILATALPRNFKR